MDGTRPYRCCLRSEVVPSIPTSCTVYFSAYNLPERSLATVLSVYKGFTFMPNTGFLDNVYQSGFMRVAYTLNIKTLCWLSTRLIMT